MMSLKWDTLLCHNFTHPGVLECNQYSVLVQCTSTVYQYSVLIQCTSTVYQYSVPIQCTDTMYVLHSYVNDGKKSLKVNGKKS